MLAPVPVLILDVATKFAAVTLAPAATLPVTAKLVNVPRLVMFGCAGVINVPATLVNVPFAADTLPIAALPATASSIRVPSSVILV
jgi:hypothetical protein